MVHHIVLWNYADDLSPARRKELSQEIKEGLEALADRVSGVLEMRVAEAPMAGSNVDIALISAFESEEALALYQEHPAHKRMGGIIRPVMKDRRCIDYQG